LYNANGLEIDAIKDEAIEKVARAMNIMFQMNPMDRYKQKPLQKLHSLHEGKPKDWAK